MSNVDLKFSGQIFRKDFPMIIAQDRQLAKFMAVTLAYDAAGYTAGEVLARNSTSGLYQAYNDSASSGLDTAKCVLFEDHPVGDFHDTVSTVTARALIGGVLYYDKLTGIDANGRTDLGAKLLVDAHGTNLMSF